MNAKEALRISEERAAKMLTPSLNKIYMGIKKVAAAGQRHYPHEIRENHQFLTEIIDSLKNDGYEVTHKKGVDPYSGDAWSFLNISW